MLKNCQLYQVLSASRQSSWKSSFTGEKFIQGRIEPLKAARGHATFRSACIDGIVLSVTKNNGSG